MTFSSPVVIFLRCVTKVSFAKPHSTRPGTDGSSNRRSISPMRSSIFWYHCQYAVGGGLNLVLFPEPADFTFDASVHAAISSLTLICCWAMASITALSAPASRINAIELTNVDR